MRSARRLGRGRVGRGAALLELAKAQRRVRRVPVRGLAQPRLMSPLLVPATVRCVASTVSGLMRRVRRVEGPREAGAERGQRAEDAQVCMARVHHPGVGRAEGLL